MALLPGHLRSSTAAADRLRQRRTMALVALAVVAAFGVVTGGAESAASRTASGTAARTSRTTATTSVSSIRRTNWIVPLAVSCTGPAGVTCRGRISLVIRVLNKRTGKRGNLVLGAQAYSIKSGTKRAIRVTLTERAQMLLAYHTSLKVRVRLVPSSGAGVATPSRMAITLRAPED